MPILDTRDVRATRFESSASNDTETTILKGPFVNISRIVGILRAYSLHKCILMTNPLPRDLNRGLCPFCSFLCCNFSAEYNDNTEIKCIINFFPSSIVNFIDGFVYTFRCPEASDSRG